MNNSSKGKQHDILHRFIEESNRMISTLQRYKKFPRNEHFYFFFFKFFPSRIDIGKFFIFYFYYFFFSVKIWRKKKMKNDEKTVHT